MTRVLGRPVWDIRNQYGEDWSKDELATAIHESAHATVATVLGYRVTAITIENDAGECRWSHTSESTEDHRIITAAGAGAASYIDASIYPRDADAWWGCGKDRADLDRLHVEPWERELYRRRAESILQTHWQLFDRFATALLEQGGALDERAVRSVLDPSARRATPPDDASRMADLLATNMAQARMLSPADLTRAEAIARSAVKGENDTPSIASPRRSSPPRRGAKRTMRDVVPDLRYSDAITVRGGQA